MMQYLLIFFYQVAITKKMLFVFVCVMLQLTIVSRYPIKKTIGEFYKRYFLIKCREYDTVLLFFVKDDC